MSDERNTREQILDIAIDLFTERGYDATSLREIAERLGITKAALYYHFPSKADILGTLADRMYERLWGATEAEALLEERDPATWGRAVLEMLDRLLDNARLFAMFERNHAAMEQVESLDDRHDARQEELQALMSDPTIPVDDRVRFSAAIGAVFFAATHALTVFSAVPTEELRSSLRRVVGEVLGPSCRASGSAVARQAAKAVVDGRVRKPSGRTR